MNKQLYNLLKRYCLFLSVVLMGYSTLNSQCSSVGNAWLMNQSKVDDFAIIFQNCDTIFGNLFIGTGGLNNGPTDIVSISGLSFLKAIVGHVYITGTSLQGLNGLHNIGFIGGSIYIKYNDILENLSGFPNIEEIQEGITVSGNKKLINLSGMENVTTIKGSLSIVDNDDLLNLNGLDNLAFVESWIRIEGNELLSNLNGLEALENIQKAINIKDNFNLVNLEGLLHLEKVKQISITSNNNMISLKGIGEAVVIEEKIYVYSNDQLSNCSEAWLCNYLLNDGEAIINGNELGCNNIEQVVEECLISIVDNPIDYGIKVYPNPFDSYIIIENPLNLRFAQVKIHNSYGELLSVTFDSQITFNTSHFPKGIYFIEILIDGSSYFKKLIKS